MVRTQNSSRPAMSSSVATVPTSFCRATVTWRATSRERDTWREMALSFRLAKPHCQPAIEGFGLSSYGHRVAQEKSIVSRPETHPLPAFAVIYPACRYSIDERSNLPRKSYWPKATRTSQHDRLKSCLLRCGEERNQWMMRTSDFP